VVKGLCGVGGGGGGFVGGGGGGVFGVGVVWGGVLVGGGWGGGWGWVGVCCFWGWGGGVVGWVFVGGFFFWGGGGCFGWFGLFIAFFRVLLRAGGACCFWGGVCLLVVIWGLCCWCGGLLIGFLLRLGGLGGGGVGVGGFGGGVFCGGWVLFGGFWGVVWVGFFFLVLVLVVGCVGGLLYFWGGGLGGAGIFVGGVSLFFVGGCFVGCGCFWFFWLVLVFVFVVWGGLGFLGLGGGCVGLFWFRGGWRLFGCCFCCGWGEWVIFLGGSVVLVLGGCVWGGVLVLGCGVGGFLVGWWFIFGGLVWGCVFFGLGGGDLFWRRAYR